MSASKKRGLTRFLKDGQTTFFRYLVVGGVAWVVDFLVYLAVYADVGVVLAQTLARIVGAGVAFAGHKLLVFGDRDLAGRRVGFQAAGYAGLWVFSYLFSTAALAGLVNLAQVHPVVAKLTVESSVIAINFLVMKAWIFRGIDRGGAGR